MKSQPLSRAHFARTGRCVLLCLLHLCFALPAFAEEHPPQRSPSPLPSEREVPLAVLLTFAAEHAPLLSVARERQGYARAAEAGADPLLRHNPVLEFGIGPRFNARSGRDFDFNASLSQPVEVGGQRTLRLNAATRLGERLSAQSVAVAWELRRQLTLTYRDGVVARERAQIAAQLVAFSDEMLSIAQRRLTAGDATAIDVRVAQTDRAQALQAKLSAEQDYHLARLRLAELTGWDVQTPPHVVAGLQPVPTPPPLASLTAQALNQHPELRVQRAAVNEAQARTKAAEREAWPTPSFGVQLEREGTGQSGANYILLGNLGLQVPFWQRNQGERARSQTDENVARAEQSASERALVAKIARAHAELLSASQRLELFTSDVAPQLESSLSLLRRGFEAGELPLLNVAVARERFLAARHDALRAYADCYHALAELEYVLGAPLTDAIGAQGGAR